MKAVLAILPALLLSACVAAPTTTPQQTPLTPRKLGLGPTPAPRLAGQWWKAFGDPQADRLAAQLLKGNPTLAGAMARIRAAQAVVAANRAQDRPQVTLNAQESRLLFSDTYIYPPPYGGSYRWIGQVVGNLDWNLDFWGKQAALIEKARDTAQAAMLDRDAARLALSGSFAQVYIDLLLAYQDGDIAAATVAEREQILKLTQGRYDAGLENASAVEEAKALVALAKADQKRFSAQREVDVHAIAALVGQGADAYAGITRPTPALDTALPLPQTLPADLLARRPDILAARARVDAAAAGRKAAHAAFYPNVDLTALMGFQAIGLSNLFTGGTFTYGAGPAIDLPIFDAGKIRADYAGATARLDGAIADYNGAVLGAVRQVADALTRVRSLESERADQQAALDSATRAFHLAEERYRDGLSGQIPMLTAESTLLTARQSMAALEAQCVIQRVTLLLAVGGDFTPPAARAASSSANSVQDPS